jgi:hypothetical protein
MSSSDFITFTNSTNIVGGGYLMSTLNNNNIVGGGHSNAKFGDMYNHLAVPSWILSPKKNMNTEIIITSYSVDKNHMNDNLHDSLLELAKEIDEPFKQPKITITKTKNKNKNKITNKLKQSKQNKKTQRTK